MKKVNVAELLKDCPKGMELDSPVWDNIVFEELDDDNIVIFRKCCSSKVYLTQYGTVNAIDGKCVIFPKGKTTWEGFHRPFKDGDVVATNSGAWLGIITGVEEKGGGMPSYCVIKGDGTFEAYLDIKREWYFSRLATEEERQKLFKVIEANGYKWNDEAKTLEKITKPEFKVGDKIRHKNDKTVITITGIKDNYYFIQFYNIRRNDYQNEKVLFKDQDEYELVPNKFDISTLIPFESKVLVRDYSHEIWRVSFWGCLINSEYGFKYDTTRGSYKQCIPYERNEHLLGKMEDCADFYKNW